MALAPTTVSCAVAWFDAVCARMFTEPVATPLTVPVESTCATDGSALVQVTCAFAIALPPTSVTVARSFIVLCTETCAVPGLTATHVGAGAVLETTTKADARCLPEAIVI